MTEFGMTNQNPDPASPTNLALQAVDAAIRDALPDPAEQLGVLIMANVLAMRRFLAVNGVAERGRRMRAIKAAVAQFDSRLREFVKP